MPAKLNFPEPNTPQEERALEILRDAKIETDEDYKALAQLIADEVSEME